MSAFPMFSAAATAVASAIQAWIALSQIRDEEQEVIRHWEARDRLRSEISYWHPLRRWRRGAEVRDLIDRTETPEFRRKFSRIRWSLGSWVLLMVGSVYGVVASITG